MITLDSLQTCVTSRQKQFTETGQIITVTSQMHAHTPSVAFWHLPPNSARFSYATEGALFISVQLSTDMVSELRKVWILFY